MDTVAEIKQRIAEHPVVIFMKGTPAMPMCGFSSRTVDALKRCEVEFAYCNVLAEPAVRENLPNISDWPTFPQIFINGELIGGCDIAMELFESGELKQMAQSAVGKQQA